MGGSVESSTIPLTQKQRKRLRQRRVGGGRLLRKHSISRSPRTFYAAFDGIGTVIVINGGYETLEPEQTCRVKWRSPRTKRGGWWNGDKSTSSQGQPELVHSGLELAKISSFVTFSPFVFCFSSCSSATSIFLLETDAAMAA